MNEITTVGLDLAKNILQAVDAEGTTVLRKQLRRAQTVSLCRLISGLTALCTPASRAKWLLQEIWMAETNKDALVASAGKICAALFFPTR